MATVTATEPISAEEFLRMDLGEPVPTVYQENDVVENLPELSDFRCVVPEFFA